MPLPVVMPSLAAVKYYVGIPLGPTDWVPITQQRIDAFAEATDDHQWVHVDVERARRESPWKSTIAHGYLTLSLAPRLLAELMMIIGWRTAINTGMDRMRLSSPVLAGSRIRLWAEIRKVREVPGGGLRVTVGVRFEVEGATKPACLADVNYVYFP